MAGGALRLCQHSRSEQKLVLVLGDLRVEIPATVIAQ